MAQVNQWETPDPPGLETIDEQLPSDIPMMETPRGTSAEPNGRKWHCSWCGKPFSRKEHLERHTPKHTGHKPYRCPICDIGYNRKDLLSRHMTTMHSKRDFTDSTASNMMATSGHRTAIACERCFKAKTKCDREEPCENCSKKGYTGCRRRYSKRSTAKEGGGVKKSSAGLAGSPFILSAALQPGYQHEQHVELHFSPQQQPEQQQQLQMILEQLLFSPQQNEQQSAATIDPSLMSTGLSPRPIASPAQGGLNSMLSVTSPVMLQGSNNGFNGFIGYNALNISQPNDGVDNDSILTPDYVDPSYGTSNGQMSFPSDANFTTPNVNWDVDHMGMWAGDLGRFGTIVGLPTTIPEATETPDAFVKLSPGTISSSFPPSDYFSGSTRRTTRETSLASSLGSEKDDRPRFAYAQASFSPIPEFDVVVRAEAWWPLARCVKPTSSDTCPNTATTHLTCLIDHLRRNDTWKALEQFVNEIKLFPTHPLPFGELNNIPQLIRQTLDRASETTQQFLQKALEIHKMPHILGGSRIKLPPTDIVHFLLKSYAWSLSEIYPLIHGGLLDPNTMVARGSKIRTLLFLLMIARGAAAVPVAEARYLSTGLTETCRISLGHAIQPTVASSAHVMTLRCALLLTQLGTWSGDKSFMEDSFRERSMYMAMLKQFGMLQGVKQLNYYRVPEEAQYSAWIEQESRNRLTSNWVMMDQELALFYDSTLCLDITEVKCPLPSPEHLWMAPNFKEWQRSIQQQPSTQDGISSQAHPIRTIGGLWWAFLLRNLNAQTLTPMELRLLLHGIQANVCNWRRQRAYPSEHGSDANPELPPMGLSSTALLNDTRRQLNDWVDLAYSHFDRDKECPITRCSLVMFHLLNLNLATNFPEIESLARHETSGISTIDFYLTTLPGLQTTCIDAASRQAVVYHCGQVLALLHDLPAHHRPSWWPAALYRATLILWADTLFQTNPMLTRNNPMNPPTEVRCWMINLFDKDEASACAHLCVYPPSLTLLGHGTGEPLCTQMALNKPSVVLNYAITMIEGANVTRFGDSIRRKLYALNSNWEPMLTAALAF